jgi:ATP-dependent Lon protease
VLIPEQNVKDLADIPDNVKNKLEIVPVRWIEKVLEVALERQPEPIVDVPAVAASSSSSVATATSDGQGGVVKH